MLHVHAVDASNSFAYRKHLDSYFCLRHEVYVNERGWHELRRLDGREIDAFDTSDAIHLLGIQPGRGVVAGSRLVPTLRPHLMSEVFPQLAHDRVPRRHDIFEWTRIFVARDLREPGRPCQAAGVIYCGILEFCIQRYIRSLTIVCEAYWFERLASIGWNPRQLGPSLQRDGMTIIGLMVDMSPAALVATQDFYRMTEPVLWAEGMITRPA
ncbi:acyl-homoserine-lactone synthase [Mesorhizobium tianshanense]|uniref:Acyl-homoserine-lactone synthase n=1 Tax=Mesorhizobium tianshanense TaxID=39844 RepID=A0A562N934_9HYPH|nr:acyl-homoserine-lactone synthase [Mesorhizobium tianshanense]TWI28401.1 acyl-homoserine lactone synthase [Mesorhizobium tianshanense]